MNTRLQVEHPVTEMITGLDLVAEQLRVAAGERLSISQADVRTAGHAIELRVYAEAAARNFAPTTGQVLRLGVPAGPGIRFDSGIAEGQKVTAAFDPMLAKLIVHADTRDAAIQKALNALRELAVLGCETNTAFLGRVVGHEAFRSGAVHTGFLDAAPAIAAEPPLPDELRDKLLAIAALSLRPIRDAADAVPALHAAMGEWRN